MDLRLPARVLQSLTLLFMVPLGLGQQMAERTLSASHIGASVSEMTIPAEQPGLPPELKAESAIYLQRRLGQWTEANAKQVLGEPRRRRDAYEDKAITGDIYAFGDPSGRYREFELLFNRRRKSLAAVFIYPWRMTWHECLDLWGSDVNTTQVANGNLFHSYRERRLDVLVDKAGNVVNLGIY